jgi:hypothetical protein
MILLCSLPLLTASASAENLIEPGQWKVTSNSVMNGAAMPPQVKHQRQAATSRVAFIINPKVFRYLA